MMHKILDVFEKGIVQVLLVLMSLVVLLATISLAWTIVTDVLAPPLLICGTDALLEIFGAFLLVLVGLELLDTIKAYLEEHVVHAEVVLIAGLIAVARKAITLNIKEAAPFTLLGVAAVIIALAGGYRLLKHPRGEVNKPPAGSDE